MTIVESRCFGKYARLIRGISRVVLSGANRTPIELFLAGLSDWDSKIRRRVIDNNPLRRGRLPDIVCRGLRDDLIQFFGCQLSDPELAVRNVSNAVRSDTLDNNN